MTDVSNHNKDFYRLQKQIMPDWEKWKNKLESVSS
ncbi:MAG: M48 family metallopeptidase [Chlorobi bacterium]|nr:M48 family metallopeptidase [Chlorobiota bacterium]